MVRVARVLTAIVLTTTLGCSFTEDVQISRPDDSTATTAAGSESTTSAVASGAEPLERLADNARPEPGATVAVKNLKQLKTQLASTKTAADLPTSDGRYDLTGRVIVAPRKVIDGLVDDGLLPGAVTADVTFVEIGSADTGDSAEPAQGVQGAASDPAPSGRSGSLLIGETGPVRLVIADSADCCGFALVRDNGAYSVEVSASPQGPTTLHAVAVAGLQPVAKAPKADDYVPPAATAKPIGKVKIPDMTVKPPKKTKRPPGVTDPPASPEKRATVELPPPVPPGSWCGYLAMRGVSFDEVVDIWNGLGRPDHMDADHNGIPCETRY